MVAYGINPSIEIERIDTRFTWHPLFISEGKPKKIRAIWYVGLPLSRAHRGSHSGGGRDLPTNVDQSKYKNEGTVYPHAALVEIITYQKKYFPNINSHYIDLSHEQWELVSNQLKDNPPDLLVLTAYTATYIWALIVAAQAKSANPNIVIIIGNDHVNCLPYEILNGNYGKRLFDYIGLGNNGPFTVLGLISTIEYGTSIKSVPSLGYRKNDQIILQQTDTFPLAQRLLPDYRLISQYLIDHYDPAFQSWYGDFYELQRMVTLPIDSGCHWGQHPKRRCKHCSIQGLTPKTASTDAIIQSFETIVGEIGANIYSTGDSTFGFSKGQWPNSPAFLESLADQCSKSKILQGKRFMLAYGLVSEFENAAELCSGFVQTWNVGIEAFDPRLLHSDSKSINKGIDATYRALELAETLGYKVYLSGILGLPGSSHKDLEKEVKCWIELAKKFSNIITTISVSVPGVIPGSRMYKELMDNSGYAKTLNSELIQCRKLSEIYISKFTSVSLADVEQSVENLGMEILKLGSESTGNIKFGGYTLGGDDESELREITLLNNILNDTKYSGL